MKVIIAGSRTIDDMQLLIDATNECGYDITEVVSGHARGVDRMGEIWAKAHGIPIKVMPAQWNVHGRGAGYIRNEEMASYADALVAVWDGSSKGTEHMVKCMKRLSKPLYVLSLNKYQQGE